MISNRILQTTVDGLKAISRVDLCIVDADKNVAAKTFDNVSECLADAISFIDSPAESQAVNGFQFFKVEDDGNLEYIIMARGTSDLDNLLRVDMYTRAEKLHIETDVKRVVYIIETKHEKDTNALETVRTLFANKTRDFITAVDEKSIILVKEVKGNESYDELDKTADVIIDMLSTEAMSAAHVAYGTIVNDIREVSRSYKEAKMALDVGKIFYSNKNVVAYNRLGIGRLIYQLPIPLCQMFIKEIFEGKAPDDFDDETLSTINKFFENSLNVSETSRQLYIHRNTLVYRLDKIQKITGLDLRVFDDAITFKIALMVVKYMKYMESKDTF